MNRIDFPEKGELTFEFWKSVKIFGGEMNVLMMMSLTDDFVNGSNWCEKLSSDESFLFSKAPRTD